jgi:glycosyltransferase involved in cell wall biosynthesis
MKILIAAQHRNIVGGVETYLRALVPALIRRGHDIAMLYDHAAGNGGPMVDPEETPLPVWSTGDLRRSPESWRELTSWEPDVVFSNCVESLDIDEKLQQRYPAVLYIHGYWGTCPTGRKCHKFPKMQTCERAFGPACLALHYPRRCGGLSPITAWKMYQVEKARNSRLADYQAVLVGSTHMYSEFERNGVSSEKLHLVRLPLTETASFAPATRKDPGDRLLFVGRLTDLKGVDFLIRAMPHAQTKLGKKLMLTVAGDGAELGRLQTLAHQQGVAVEFAGWVDSSRRLDLMRKSDLLVVPSLWPEPFGLVGIEAAAVGLPAAGFAAGGIPDWLISGRTGELAPADSPSAEGLANAIAMALGDPDHYSGLCQGAFEFSRQFTMEKHTAELEAILSRSASASEPLVTPRLAGSIHGR